MQMIVINIAIVLLLALMPSIAASDFCDEQTTEAYHSPLCKHIWVVQDPQRVDDVEIKPYHTYSRWVIDKQTYIFAYRDIYYNPDDMMVDIYLVKDGAYMYIGSVRIPGYIVNVFTSRLTSKVLQDIVFRFDNGQLQYISVVKLENGRVEEVFEYGASVIDVKDGSKPTIVAKSRLANVVQIFMWDTATKKFVKIREFPWRKAKE